MNGKSILAVALGTIVNFLLGWIIYGMLLLDFMEAQLIQYEGLMNEESAGMMMAYVVSSLAMALLITYVLQRGTVTARKGAAVGAVTGLLIAISYDVMFYFGWNLASGIYYIVDALAFMVMMIKIPLQKMLTGLTLD